MNPHSIETSPQRYARSAGLLYLGVILLGAFAEGWVADRLIVGGDAAATAARILAAPELWQLGLLSNLLVVVLAVPQMWIEYLLLRPVSPALALLTALLNVVSLAVEAISKLFLLLVQPLLAPGATLQAFDTQQLQAFAYLAYRTHDLAFNIALIFFGLTCLVSGQLIARSGYLPWLIGRLLQLAGLSYLLACGAALFAPALSAQISPAILMPALIGESSMCLWLLIKGVDVPKWQAAVAAGKAQSGAW